MRSYQKMSNEQLCKDYVDMVTNLLSKPNLHGLDAGTVGEYEDTMKKLENDLNLVHLALGIAGEALELSIATDEVNVLEELGDICFYTVGAAIHLRPQLGLPFSDTHAISAWLNNTINSFKKEEKSFHNLFCSCDKAADYIKKKVFYQQKKLKNSNDDIEWDIHRMLYDILAAINSIKPLPEVMQANMQKLGTRYQSGKFSTEEATNRKDKENDQSN